MSFITAAQQKAMDAAGRFRAATGLYAFAEGKRVVLRLTPEQIDRIIERIGPDDDDEGAAA